MEQIRIRRIPTHRRKREEWRCAASPPGGISSGQNDGKGEVSVLSSKVSDHERMRGINTDQQVHELETRSPEFTMPGKRDFFVTEQSY